MQRGLGVAATLWLLPSSGSASGGVQEGGSVETTAQPTELASSVEPKYRPNPGIEAVEGISLGHHTLEARPTGCTVVLVPEGAVGGVDVRGGAPGTAETDLLDPVNTVSELHAVVLAGGSAFGLAARDGVVRLLDESGYGFAVGDKRVPIVAAAILYDLGLEGSAKVHPDAECGYQAGARAMERLQSDRQVLEPPRVGRVGAGAGATVGKLLGPGHAMFGGFGTYAIELEDGLVVAAAVAVNSVGDVVDPATGRVVAGIRDPVTGELLDARRVLRGSGMDGYGKPGAKGLGAWALGNTTIGVVATNAALNKAQATKVAQMAQDGIARAVYPSHTPNDGDTVFSLATGSFAGETDLTLIGTLAADALVEAILQAVTAANAADGPS